MPDPLQFRMHDDGYAYATASDGTVITRVFPAGHNVVVYYKYSRPDIDKQRVRLRYEDLHRYGLAENVGMRKPFALDQHDNMHWGSDVRRMVGTDKDGFPLYEWQSEEMLGPGVEDGKATGTRSIIMPGWNQ